MSTVPHRLRVCMLAAEARPYATVGGLADVIAALPPALERQGVEVRVFTPLYRRVALLPYIKKIADLGEGSVPNSVCPCSLWGDIRQDPIRNYFIGNDDCFDREGVYDDPGSEEGYPDNFERFNFFMVAALEALRFLDWKPHVLHCHDWETALVPAYLKLGRMGEPFYKDISTVLTIHNLAYQGIFPAEKFGQTGIPLELFYPLGPFEYYGHLNILKAGLCYADVLNTVSEQYAREIQTEEYGCGLDPVLGMRKEDLYGILNGIDIEEWNPATDQFIHANYSAENLSGKQINKEMLQDSSGFAVRDVPLIGMISRLADQKGLDLFLKAFDDLRRIDCQWVLLGTGLKKYQGPLLRLARNHPERLSVFLQYENRLAHQIAAGSDMFLMPSRYEPCGLNQFYGMRYGTVPIVRHTGGLGDTVRDFSQENGLGNGFKFFDYDSAEMVNAIRRAVDVWRKKESWLQLVKNGMTEDFSWDQSARRYVDLYHKAIVYR
jgi:starch synthase